MKRNSNVVQATILALVLSTAGLAGCNSNSITQPVTPKPPDQISGGDDTATGDTRNSNDKRLPANPGTGVDDTVVQQ